MECKYNNEEICTNDQCPMCADYCPVPDTEGVCKYEEREDVRFKLTPKGCLAASLLNAGVELDLYDFDDIWNDFVDSMTRFGYVQEEG